jgi:hypothetical protein
VSAIAARHGIALGGGVMTSVNEFARLVDQAADTPVAVPVASDASGAAMYVIPAPGIEPPYEYPADELVAAIESDEEGFERFLDDRASECENWITKLQKVMQALKSQAGRIELQHLRLDRHC